MDVPFPPPPGSPIYDSFICNATDGPGFLPEVACYLRFEVDNSISVPEIPVCETEKINRLTRSNQKVAEPICLSWSAWLNLHNSQNEMSLPLPP